jgi:hypothetical protein
MNSGQGMLVIGAFALLATLTLSINRTLLSTTNLGFEMESTLNALSFAQSMMDEILLSDFDEQTTTGVKVYNASDFRALASFGPDAGTYVGSSATVEQAITWYDTVITAGNILAGTITTDFKSKVYYDDVDDYHDYKRYADDEKMGRFTIRDTVQYVNEDYPDDAVTTQTQHKRIIVNIQHFSMVKDNNGTVIPVRLLDLSVYRRFFQ